MLTALEGVPPAYTQDYFLFPTPHPTQTPISLDHRGHCQAAAQAEPAATCTAAKEELSTDSEQQGV